MNLVLDQGNNFHLISLSLLITCLLDNVWILQGEVPCQSLLGVNWLKVNKKETPYMAKKRKEQGFDVMISLITLPFNFFNIPCGLVNPLTPNVSLVILLTVCQTVLVILVWRIWFWIN